MNDKVHITALELENVKRVKAVALDCAGQSLTVIGGRNGQGKTSCLDAIAWALGGDRFRPTNPVRDGAEEAYIKVVLDNGMTVERGGKNGTLKVTAPSGKGGQALLNEVVNQFALNLPKFMQATGTEKAKMLLDCFPGLGKELQRLNGEVKRLYSERLALGQIADRKAKYANEMPYDSTAPESVLSGVEMTAKMRAALAHNAKNDSIRRDVQKAQDSLTALTLRHKNAATRVKDLEEALLEARNAMEDLQTQVQQQKAAMEAAMASTLSLQDQDTRAIEEEMEKIDSINAKVRMNESKKNAEDEARVLQAQYTDMSRKIDEARAARLKLLAGVRMPMNELSVDEEGELIYRGQKWDCMADSERMQVGTAICAAVQPKCGFVLLDALEKFDHETLQDFALWLSARGLQAIGTRVSTGDECSVIIEDGMVRAASDELDI